MDSRLDYMIVAGNRGEEGVAVWLPFSIPFYRYRGNGVHVRELYILTNRCDLKNITAVQFFLRGVLFSAYQVTHLSPDLRGTVLSLFDSGISQDTAVQLVCDLDGIFLGSDIN